jgi:DNA-binding transcriptional ArsR family regulator
MDNNALLLNPIRGRIIQHVAVSETVTAGDLAQLMQDVPRTTLYRHLKLLAEHGILSVVAETRVRGSVERTYALSVERLREINSKENTLNNCFGFLMKIYADLARYFADESADPAADKIFLANNTLLLSDEEFDELLADVGNLLRKHLPNQRDGKRRQRILSIISSPSFDERTETNHEN